MRIRDKRGLSQSRGTTPEFFKRRRRICPRDRVGIRAEKNDNDDARLALRRERNGRRQRRVYLNTMPREYAFSRISTSP